MPLATCSIDTVDDFSVSLCFPEDLFFFQVKDLQLPLKVSECKASVRRRASGKCSCLDAACVFDGRNDFQLAFCELSDLNQARGFGSFSAYYKFAGLRDPLDVIGSVIN